MKKTLVMIVLFLNALVAKAGTTRPEIPDHEYVKYGSQYESVVKISGVCEIRDGKEVVASGSGVVIDPHWVVTAAHVLKSMEHPYFYINDKKYNVSKVIINKEFDMEKPLSNGDIGLCYVEEEIEISFYPSLYEKQDEINKVCGISGYGVYSSATSSNKKSDNNRRAGSNIVSAVTEDLLICDMSRNKTTSLEFLISHGDSGGGLFIDGKLAGVNSYVSATDGKPDSSYGDQSAHTRVSKYKGWIEENIRN